MNNPNSIEAAFIDAAEHFGFELIWTVCGSAIPGGLVSRDAYEYFSGHLFEGIRAAGAIDGMHLHGAMVTDDLDDGERHVLEAIRRVVGPAMPIGYDDGFACQSDHPASFKIAKIATC